MLMIEDQYKEGKKIWVDPELTFMPMKVVKVPKTPNPLEHTVNVPSDDVDGHVDHPPRYYGS